MAKLGDLVVRIGANTKGFNAKLGALKGQIRKDTKNIAAMGRNMSMGITAPLVAIGATSFKVAADFEQSMAKVKAISGATGDEFKKLQDNAKELGRTTRFTASEVSALQLEYAKLGFSADEITEVTAATLNLAQATGSDLAQSAEVAGATLRAFGLNASETQRVTDVMAVSFSKSSLDINSFQDSMKYVAPVAKAAGVSLEEATAMLGHLATNGIKGSQAGTSLRRILQDVAGTGQPFSKAMKMSADEVINLADAKDEVGRSASSAFLVLKEGMGDVAGLTTTLQHAEGAAAGMAAGMDDTAEGAMKRMQSAIEGAQIEIGTALAPTMVKLANTVAGLATRFSEMSDGGKGLIFVLAGLAGGIGPILMILPGLVQGIKLAKIAMSRLNLTMLANPFVAVAAAIVAATAYLVSWTREQNEARRAALEHRIELAKQAQAMRDAFGDTQTQSVDDLRKSISLVRSEIEKFSTAKIMEGLTFDASEVFGGIKLGKGAQVLNPETQKKLKESLKNQFMVLSAEAMRLGFFGDQATSHIRKGMEKVVERTVSSYRENLQNKQEELQKALGEALGEAVDENSGKVSRLVKLYGGDAGLTRKMFEANNAAYLLSQELKNLGTTLEDVLEPDKKTESFTVNLELGEIEEFDMEEEIFGDEENFAAAGDVIIKKLDEIKEKSERVMATASTLGNSLGATFANLRNQGTEIKLALESGLITPLEAMEQKSESSKKAIRSLARDGIMALINLAKMNVIANATSPANAGNLVSGGLATPAFIVAGLSMLEGFLGGMTAFADGGIVSGPTMGLVGEYPGAKTNPEVIAPLDKLRSMMGGQNVVVTGRLSGRDILLSSEMSNIDRNRVRGF